MQPGRQQAAAKVEALGKAVGERRVEHQFAAACSASDALDLGQQISLLLVAMVTSKGASGVTGAGFVTLAATLQAVPGIPLESLALLVEVSLADADVVFSDNYFNIPAGRTVRVTCPLPAGWTLDKARKALQLRSVYDSFSHGAVS